MPLDCMPSAGKYFSSFRYLIQSISKNRKQLKFAVNFAIPRAPYMYSSSKNLAAKSEKSKFIASNSQTHTHRER